ncbi:MAG: WD40 repeat domain-containing protein [Acidimicrobiales bacterium]
MGGPSAAARPVTAVAWIDGGRSVLVRRLGVGFEVLGLDGGGRTVSVPGAVFAWDASPSGRYVVVSTASIPEPPRSAIVSLEGGSVDLGAVALTPVVSSDGTTIRLFRGDGSIRIVDPSGAVLSDWAPSDFSPGGSARASWSPSGRLIFDTRIDQTAAVLDATSGAVTSFPDLAGTPMTRWFDDDHLVAGRSGSSDAIPNWIEIRDIHTGESTLVTSNAGWPVAMRGTGLIAVSSLANGTIDVVRADGSGRRPVLVVGAGYRTTPVVWSPDQQLLVVSVCAM